MVVAFGTPMAMVGIYVDMLATMTGDASSVSSNVLAPNSGQLQASVCSLCQLRVLFGSSFTKLRVPCREQGAQFARASCPVVSYRLRCAKVPAACTTCPSFIRTKESVPCREPEAQFAKAAALFLTASAY